MSNTNLNHMILARVSNLFALALLLTSQSYAQFTDIYHGVIENPVDDKLYFVSYQPQTCEVDTLGYDLDTLDLQLYGLRGNASSCETTYYFGWEGLQYGLHRFNHSPYSHSFLAIDNDRINLEMELDNITNRLIVISLDSDSSYVSSIDLNSGHVEDLISGPKSYATYPGFIGNQSSFDVNNNVLYTINDDNINTLQLLKINLFNQEIDTILDVEDYPNMDSLIMYAGLHLDPALGKLFGYGREFNQGDENLCILSYDILSGNKEVVYRFATLNSWEEYEYTTYNYDEHKYYIAFQSDLGNSHKNNIFEIDVVNATKTAYCDFGHYNYPVMYSSCSPLSIVQPENVVIKLNTLVEDQLQFISDKGITSLEVINLNGQIIYNKSFSSTKEGTVAMSFLNEGMYIVKFTLVDGTQQTKRIVKSR